MGIDTENQEIENNIKKISSDLFKENKVDVIIGYKKGTLPLMAQPIIIEKEEDVEKLIWNNTCYVNLAKYLVPRIPKFVDAEKGNLRVGVVSKGCVGRALIHLASENQLNLEEIKIIGFSCNGVINRQRIEQKIGQKEIREVFVKDNKIYVKGKDFEQSFPYEEYLNELCKVCKVKKPPITAELSDVCVGECQEYSSISDDFNDVSEFELKTTEEKWEYVKNSLDICTRCYACREACPMCYCNLCFVDQNKPVWFGKTTDISDIMVFHLIRAMHMAGRCVGCGTCSSVCPVGIDLYLINRKLEEIVKRRYHFTSGLDPKILPPMMSFEMEDSQEFMLEED
ncbi:MAG: Coenzyme F420 hydrogenase/dehydrogenase, beta subunit C-terminal domain [Candidatus Lokiarchaeota archaeon]|nr:Coenzyme F420 hydrogenase/dehydrogenase, beta subunit C-terminal domain [Candidatus Lokiarchaeota archaeon]